MNKAKKIEFIKEINEVVNVYVNMHKLFCGGCCYAAFLIASCFDMVGIKYKTAIFQYYDILNVRNFNKAINGNGVAHVAIEVKVNGVKTVIGSCDGVYRYFNSSKEHFHIRHYSKVNPYMILEGYVNNSWNDTYNRANNISLAKDITKVLEKYL